MQYYISGTVHRPVALVRSNRAPRILKLDRVTALDQAAESYGYKLTLGVLI
jgi:hypothetical protein